MPFDIDYWDEVAQKQKRRQSTPTEDAQRDADLAGASAVPQRIPMLNAHLEMIEAGWIDGVRGFIDAIPEPDRSLAFAYFDKALTMERAHPLVLSIPAAIGKTDAEVDELFIRAAARPD